ncbi:MAG: prepilin peptidase [Lachnospiraceae bacterium]|nr:prepilin peptidase [Lachnospiraceae bacterium]MBR4413168.1 prepilin peptidase [Lachnospiraceae bacterium]MBR5066538.1 prepilin peptidase [Lachnospiraceae bacterium]MBR5918162.1 prepilin peptidase [Lachnospiraceae bacterium]
MDQIKNIRFAFVFIVLGIEAITDFKKKEVNIVFPALLAATAAVMLFFTKDISLINAIIGITEGVLLILISFLTKGEIGMGDGILLAACGLMLGGRDNLIMFFFACLSSAIVSALIMIIKKADKKTKIPFVPFMIPGFLIMVFLSLG